jgi:hypothetical protein
MRIFPAKGTHANFPKNAKSKNAPQNPTKTNFMTKKLPLNKKKKKKKKKKPHLPSTIQTRLSQQSKSTATIVQEGKNPKQKTHFADDTIPSIYKSKKKSRRNSKQTKKKYKEQIMKPLHHGTTKNSTNHKNSQTGRRKKQKEDQMRTFSTPMPKNSKLLNHTQKQHKKRKKNQQTLTEQNQFYIFVTKKTEIKTNSSILPLTSETNKKSFPMP